MGFGLVMTGEIEDEATTSCNLAMSDALLPVKRCKRGRAVEGVDLIAGEKDEEQDG